MDKGKVDYTCPTTFNKKEIRRNTSNLLWMQGRKD